ncbi:hypothetical protein Hs30E_11080 [Lactococcus hodotermopsidis]|uniref:Uncharacterized protein n=1 Tax=Pseudolactococcus hodotermopsidis TaxID=2709157 RepID=A0A6A0BFF2_9LACT|nr:hypothetical protein [Lactococcus hodotermopsidis]GFH42557.1 hypothetical protein Hs30E_11080 [Lactococcus hodotermopsidis]
MVEFKGIEKFEVIRDEKLVDVKGGEVVGILAVGTWFGNLFSKFGFNK